MESNGDKKEKNYGLINNALFWLLLIIVIPHVILFAYVQRKDVLEHKKEKKEEKINSVKEWGTMKISDYEDIEEILWKCGDVDKTLDRKEIIENVTNGKTGEFRSNVREVCSYIDSNREEIRNTRDNIESLDTKLSEAESILYDLEIRLSNINEKRFGIINRIEEGRSDKYLFVASEVGYNKYSALDGNYSIIKRLRVGSIIRLIVIDSGYIDVKMANGDIREMKKYEILSRRELEKIESGIKKSKDKISKYKSIIKNKKKSVTKKIYKGTTKSISNIRYIVNKKEGR